MASTLSMRAASNGTNSVATASPNSPTANTIPISVSSAWRCPSWMTTFMRGTTAPTPKATIALVMTK